MDQLWIVCDTSGSMCEGNKHVAMRGLAIQVEQYVRLGYASSLDVKLAVWSHEVAPVAWAPSADVPDAVLDCAGRANGRALAEFLETHNRDRILILSDGFWSDDDRRTVVNACDTTGASRVRLVHVGVDANSRVGTIESFEAGDLLAALDGWCKP